MQGLLAYLRDSIYRGQDYSQHRRPPQQVFDFKRILIWVVGGLEIDKHEIYDVCLTGNEDNFENCVPKAFRRVGPEEICCREVLSDASNLGGKAILIHRAHDHT